jgi:GT2 family glycosyltransferase
MLWSFRQFLKNHNLASCWWHISGCAVRVKTYKEIGRFPLGLPMNGDWDFLLRLLGCGWDVECVPSSLIIYRANPTGVSSVSFRRHHDVLETLIVAQRHHEVISLGSVVAYHGSQLKTLARRFT